jgi:hypothetical protein
MSLREVTQHKRALSGLHAIQGGMKNNPMAGPSVKGDSTGGKGAGQDSSVMQANHS